MVWGMVQNSLLAKARRRLGVAVAGVVAGVQAKTETVDKHHKAVLMQNDLENMVKSKKRAKWLFWFLLEPFEKTREDFL